MLLRHMPFHNLHIVLPADIPYQISRPCRYLPGQRRPSIFRDPHQVQMDLEYHMGAVAIFCIPQLNLRRAIRACLPRGAWTPCSTYCPSMPPRADLRAAHIPGRGRFIINRAKNSGSAPRGRVRLRRRRRSGARSGPCRAVRRDFAANLGDPRTRASTKPRARRCSSRSCAPTASTCAAGRGGHAHGVHRYVRQRQAGDRASWANSTRCRGFRKKTQPTQIPVTAGAPGHGCGHNLLGSASALAAVAIKEEMQARGLKGTIRYYGTPAEEGGGGKIYMIHAGLFRDVDAVLTWHPGDFNRGEPGLDRWPTTAAGSASTVSRRTPRRRRNGAGRRWTAP